VRPIASFQKGPAAHSATNARLLPRGGGTGLKSQRVSARFFGGKSRSAMSALRDRSGTLRSFKLANFFKGEVMEAKFVKHSGGVTLVSHLSTWRALGEAVIVAACTSALIAHGVASAGPIEVDDPEPQELEGVTVWGSLDGSSGWGPWASTGGSTRFSDVQIAGDPAAGVAGFADSAQDARCSSNPEISGSRGTYSRSDREARATLMYRAYLARHAPLPVNSRFPVIYGDGSSEVWLISVSLPSQGTIAVDRPSNLMPPGSWSAPTPAQCAVG
jgi:hypothetical protein